MSEIDNNITFSAKFSNSSLSPSNLILACFRNQNAKKMQVIDMIS